MNQEDKIIKANSRFAEFMGAELYTPKYKGFMALFNKYNRPVYINPSSYVCSPNRLKYDLEWEWLMSVVNKIEKLGYCVSIISYYTNVDIRYKVSITLKGADTPLVLREDQDHCFTTVYLACNDFVKLYITSN